jgi:protease-4
MQAEQEQKTIEKILLAQVREARAKRRWGVFLRLLFFGYVAFITAAFLYHRPDWWEGEDGDAHAALIEINGAISADNDNSADVIGRLLRRAFAADDTSAVILRINSGGGSAVQSQRIYREIRRLRAAHPDKPLYAAVDDICASGGYFIAAAADEIYVNEASVVGSIGVIYSSFGFTEALQKLGVERRVLTAGEDKNMLDPFLPQTPAAGARIQSLLDDIHAIFISAVKEGRGERLLAAPDLFTGNIWSGGEAVRLGLADGLGDAEYIAREILNEADIVRYRPDQDWLERLGDQLGQAALRAVQSLTSSPAGKIS